ncbi:hypothetical protein [Fulvimonas yonginensis]|uniref:Uncharacterized protein n=1 Tax=Fulvimonas yonginensis TaxID=1495200 RepID=A0ABU8JEY9_9GAMM
MFDSRKHRIAAAAVALAYVAIQTFQWYAFAQLPPASAPEAQLLQGPLPINLTRAVAMLLAFPALIYLFLVTCGLVARRAPACGVAALLGFLVFCVLEIQLRSVELFYVFLHLPAQYEAATSALERSGVLAAKAAFEAVQHALYFPLGLGWTIASVLVCLGLGERRIDWLARAAFGLNALRLLLRMGDTYLLGTRFDDAYTAAYLPLVFLTFVPVAAWLLLRGEGMRPERRPVS